MLVPKQVRDLTPYMKHMRALHAQAVMENGAANTATFQGMMEGDFQILAAEGELLTDAEFEEREKDGTLPDDLGEPKSAILG